MTVTNELANFLSETTFDMLTYKTIEYLKMHLLDTIGAMLAGSQTFEGIRIGKLITKFSADRNISGYSTESTLLSSIITKCAVTRCTEVDDIHLQSCTTPGSVIIPTALSLASAGYLSNPKDFLVSVAVGYELLIRLGIAINGPKALYQGIWPTYLSAPVGSAAVGARALKLSNQQAANAISTALTMSTGVKGRFRSTSSSRWLTLGVAAQNGVIAAFSAHEGLMGDDALLDRASSRICGLRVSQAKLTDSLGQRFLVDDTAIKPYPVARQALSAVEAFREILATHQFDAGLIQEVSVWVPRQFMTIIDHPNKLPDNRLESIVSVQYQIALAAFDLQKLLDVKRERLIKDNRVSALIQKIHIKPSEELEHYYPLVWPAKVEVRINRQKYSCKILHPKGDPCNRFTWDEVNSKFRRIAKPTIGGVATEKVVNLVQKLDSTISLAHLLELLPLTTREVQHEVR